MSFTIPNLQDAAHDPQAFFNQADIDVMVQGYAANGVLSGCQVTPQGSPNMTVHVAAGEVGVNGASVLVSAADPTIPTAAVNPRRDLVVVDDAGTISVIAGTPVAIVPADPSVVPVLPDLPDDSVALASVDVPANATSITAAEILSKAIPVLGANLSSQNVVRIRKGLDQSVVSNTTLQNDTDFVFSIGVSETWFVALHTNFNVPGTPDLKVHWACPVGATGHHWGVSQSINNRDVIANDIVIVGIGGVMTMDLYATVINSTTAGSIQFQFAQFTSSGSAVVHLANSVLIAERID